MPLKYRFKYPIDAPERTLEHREIIKGKYFLRELYREWYQELLNEISTDKDRMIVELGSGGGFLKEIAPSVITSDYLDLPTNDMSFSALSMPFSDCTVDALFMIDTFHHLPDARLFLQESRRVLKSDGKVIMVEPANSPWGRFIYRNFHHEPFLPDAGWQIPASGPLSGANGALPWIVFERDQNEFYRSFPEFELEKIKYHTPFRYLLSGGLTMRSLVPAFSYPFFRSIDRLLCGIIPGFSMFMTIVLRRL